MPRPGPAPKQVQDAPRAHTFPPPSLSCDPFFGVPSGNLSCLDGYMNVAMENTREVVDGQTRASFGDAFIRGNNGESLWGVRAGVGPCKKPHPFRRPPGSGATE